MAFSGFVLQRDLQMIFHLPSLIVCFGGMISLSMADYGVECQSRVIVLMGRMWFRPTDSVDTVDALDVRVGHGMIAGAYLSGVIGIILGLIQIAVHFGDVASMRSGLAIALYCPMYAVVFVEGLLHPAVRRLEENLECP